MRDMIENLLRQRLDVLSKTTGLPVVFGGATRRGKAGEHLLITQLLGNRTRSLHGVSVSVGRGLGGTAIMRGVPCLVNDYTSSRAITHDYDRHVAPERLTSVFAVPIRVHGTVGGVVYGAVRADMSIGDVALRHANVVASKLGKDIEGLLGRDRPVGWRPAEVAADSTPKLRAALDELTMIIRSTDDPVLRARLERVCRQLGDRDPGRTASSSIRLAPRELDALRLAAVGASNAEIAHELGLSPQTIKAYLRAAMRKLNVHNRTAAVHTARESGLL
ncbi:helix-turn-helix transcriptional regulator [Pseudonocardia asaccharolytica DSM 44247 = NBRC 16224]|uniref:Helix-turn-helix transcriptional regulator n=2 Tax=Pseudonocardia asaccharolytica TaxID=54010 RepID=A0A511CYV9_9PSEU|nr:helix-turn-helix transcriptional regulator [Pseudonocardia asaccharolytica DSM 44247 = NBRC 16224]